MTTRLGRWTALGLSLLLVAVACGDDGTANGDGDETGDTGDGDGDGDGDVCAGQDATAVGNCELLLGVIWDGESCDYLSGCSCEGSDCGDLFESVDACEDVYSFCNQDCSAQMAMGTGDCDLVLGIHWNGETCQDFSGCECVGPDCGEVFETLSDCEYQYQLCVSP